MHSSSVPRACYVLHMLRWVLGPDKFADLLTKYVQKFQDTPASTEGFTQLATQVAGEDMGYFFDQWLNSSGVPEFATPTLFKGQYEQA